MWLKLPDDLNNLGSGDVVLNNLVWMLDHLDFKTAANTIVVGEAIMQERMRNLCSCVCVCGVVGIDVALNLWSCGYPILAYGRNTVRSEDRRRDRRA